MIEQHQPYGFRSESVESLAQPVRIRLERGMKGAYSWEISVSGSNEKEIFERIRLTDLELKHQYGRLSAE